MAKEGDYKESKKTLSGNLGPINNYTVRSKDITEYAAFRGVTDFSQISQFTPYEGGYQMLCIIKMPEFTRCLAEKNANFRNVYNTFKHIVEYEFKGLDGLPDLNSDTFTITDGINDIRMISKVTEDTSISVTSTYTERIGTPLTKFARTYLTGIKDPKTQARTYHGLIANGELDPDLKNEIFTMIYIVTDNTMLRLEKAVLLCNAQLTKAEESIYNGNRSDIGSTKDLTIEWNCYPVQSSEVDRIAKKILFRINGVSYNTQSNQFTRTNKKFYSEIIDKQGTAYINRHVIELDSSDYNWGAIKQYTDDSTKNNKMDNPGYIPETRRYALKQGENVNSMANEDEASQQQMLDNENEVTPNSDQEL